MHMCDTWMFKCFLCAATNVVQDTEEASNPNTNPSADDIQIPDEEPIPLQIPVPPPKKSNAAHPTHIPHRIRKRL